MATTGTIIDMHARGRHTYALDSSTILEALLLLFWGPSLYSSSCSYSYCYSTLLCMDDLEVTRHNYLGKAKQSRDQQNRMEQLVAKD